MVLLLLCDGESPDSVIGLLNTNPVERGRGDLYFQEGAEVQLPLKLQGVEKLPYYKKAKMKVTAW